MKIVHVVDYLMPSMGYQEFLLPKWNAQHGNEVHILTSDRYNPVPNYEQSWGAFLGARICGVRTEKLEGTTIHRLACRWEWKGRPWISGFEQKLRELSPDIIYCHGTGSPAAFRTAIFGRRNGIPVLMDNHMIHAAKNGSMLARFYYLPLKMFSQRILCKSTFRFFGVAQECCDFLISEQGLPSELVECLPLGIDTDLFKISEDARRRMREEFGIPPDAVILLQTGKLTLDKRPDWLSEAAAPIMAKNPKVWTWFLGSGTAKYLEQIRRPFKDNHVESRLRFIPLVPASKLGDVYNAADICIYPAGSSLSCLEAGACGKAVIVTDLPVSRWRVQHGAGISYKTGDLLDLRNKINSLIQDPEYRRGVGTHAQASAHAKFSYDAVAREAEQWMHEAIAASLQRKKESLSPGQKR